MEHKLIELKEEVDKISYTWRPIYLFQYLKEELDRISAKI